MELQDIMKEGYKSIAGKALERYDKYIESLVYTKYRSMASPEKIGSNSEEDFYEMTKKQRKQALRDMAEAIRKLTDEYKK